MDFNKNISQVLNTLRIKNGDLSKKSGIDPSVISRYKNGKRKPYKDSSEINSLVNAILILAEGKENDLAKLIECQNINELSKYLHHFFNETNLKVKKNEIKKKNKTILIRFGEKLNLVVDLLDISNIQLAYAIGVDASLISRYRNKLRLLHSNNIIINKISNYCVEEAKRKKLSYNLHCLMNTNNKYNEQQLLNNLIAWFNDEQESLSELTIEHFLKTLATYDYTKNQINTSLNRKMNIKDEYIGTIGLQDCVLDFLTIVNNANPTITHLYTNNQNILDFDNEQYGKTSSSIVQQILSKDNKLIIYHDTTNSIEDMIENIEKMLFIYFTAKCETRYIKKAINSKFQRSFFLAENTAVLSSNGVINADEYVEHTLSTDKIKIDRYTKQFEELKKMTYPLMSIYDYHSQGEYIEKYKDLHAGVGSVITFLSSPLLGTMSANLLNKILKRYNIKQELKDTIMTFHKLKRETLMKSINKTTINEYIYVANEPPSLNVTGLFLNFDIRYTKEEYKEHIDEIKALAHKYKTYNVHFTNKKPLNNIRILIKEDYGTLVTRNDGNFEITFILQHKIITQAFENYISNLINK